MTADTTATSAPTTRPAAFEVGSALLAPTMQGPAAPAGPTHLVVGWEPICGGPRVRFVFPGQAEALGATCPDCSQAAEVPRQRSAARTTASRGRSRGS